MTMCSGKGWKFFSGGVQQYADPEWKGKAVGSVVVFGISVRKQAGGCASVSDGTGSCCQAEYDGEMASGIAHELNQPLTQLPPTRTPVSVCWSPAGRQRKMCGCNGKDRRPSGAGGRDHQASAQFVSKEPSEPTQVDMNELMSEVLNLIRPEANRAGCAL